MSRGLGKSKRAAALVGLACLAAASPDGNKPLVEPVTPIAALTPSTPWASYDEDYRCTVERTFGPAPGAFAMKLGYRAGSGTLDGDFLLRTDRRPPDVSTVRVAVDDARFELPATLFYIEEQKVALVRLEAVPRLLWTALGRSGSLSLAIGKRTVATASFRGAAGATAAAEACAAKQYAALGGTSEMLAATAAPKSLAPWVRAQDYPRSSLDARVSGKVAIRYLVGTDGRPSDCRVIRSSGDAALDTASCSALLARGRFEPARGADGRPIAMVVPFLIRWQVAPDPQDPWLESFVGAGLARAPDG